MSEAFQIIVDKEATLEEAEFLAQAIHAWLVEYEIVEETPVEDIHSIGEYAAGRNYLQITTGQDVSESDNCGFDLTTTRTVFHAGGNGGDPICPGCQMTATNHEQWISAVDDWQMGGAGSLRCEHCGYTASITDWVFDWGFGNLGFTFWNWPPLSDEFIAEFHARLGHEIVVVKGRL